MKKKKRARPEPKRRASKQPQRTTDRYAAIEKLLFEIAASLARIEGHLSASSVPEDFDVQTTRPEDDT